MHSLYWSPLGDFITKPPFTGSTQVEFGYWKEQPSTSGQVKDMPERFQKIFEQQTTSKSADKVSKLCWWNCHWCQHGLAVAPRDVIDATKSHLQCLDPLQSGFVPWSTLYPVDKVLVPTSLDLDATTLRKMLKTLLMVLRTLMDIGETLDALEKH